MIHLVLGKLRMAMRGQNKTAPKGKMPILGAVGLLLRSSLKRSEEPSAHLYQPHPRRRDEDEDGYNPIHFLADRS